MFSGAPIRTYTNNHVEVVILRRPHSPRYEVETYHLDGTGYKQLVATDDLAEAEAVFEATRTEA